MAKAKRRGRGEGSIEQVGPNRWRAVLSLGKDPVTGRRRKRKLYAPSKQEVLGKLRAEQARTPGHPAAATLTVGEWLTQWLSARRPGWELNTWKFAEARVRREILPSPLSGLRLAALTRRDVVAWVGQLHEAGTTPDLIGRAAGVLRAALADACDQELIPRNVASRVPRPKVRPGERKSLTRDQLRAVLAAAEGERLAAWFWLAADAGCRPGELNGLHWPDVDLAAGTIHVKQSLEDTAGSRKLKPLKTPKSNRTLPLTPSTVARLQSHRDRMKREGRDVDAGPVFCRPDGRFLDRESFRRGTLARLRRRTGIKWLSFYSFRHSCATLLLAAGVSLRIVSERLGHQRVETTLKHYAHVLPGQQAAAILAMGAILADTGGVQPGEG